MNLAICSVGELFGGVERQILDLCQFQVAQYGQKPVVVLFFDRELAAQLRQAGIEPVILKGRNRYDLNLVNRLVDVLKDEKIEVVHAHGYKATVVSALAKKKHPFGLVKTEHGKVESNPRQPLSWLKSQINFKLEQHLTRKHVDAVCYVTNDIRSFFDQTHQGMDRRTVYNGMVPLRSKDFARPDDLPTDVVNIGLVGRVSEVKGIPIGIQAMELLRSEKKVRLNIIGTGKLVPHLQEMAEHSGLSDVVHFLGFRRNIYDYLAHLDILIMPSYHEGLPYTLLEAMSFARSIIASRVGGLAEVLEDGVSGLLCPAGDPVALARNIEILLEQENDEMGRQAQFVQAEGYTLDVMGGQYTEVYKESLKAAGIGGAGSE